jgi:UDP-glucose 4-epimerase
VIIHLAAMHFIPECNANPLEAYETNVTGTIHVLRAAELCATPHCLIASSGSIYLDQADPLEEEKTPVACYDVYSLTKLHVEQATAVFSLRRPGSRFTVARLFNTYGPRETNPHIIPEIIKQLKSERIVRLGNLKPRRDFIFVSDAAAGLIAMSKRTKGNPFEIYNLCSGKDHSMEEVIGIIKNLLPFPFEVISDPAKYRIQDKMFQRGSVEKLTGDLGIVYSYNLTEGLKKIIQFENLT